MNMKIKMPDDMPTMFTFRGRIITLQDILTMDDLIYIRDQLKIMLEIEKLRSKKE